MSDDNGIARTAACVIELADRLAFDPEALDDLTLDERVQLLAKVADAKDALQSVYRKVERGCLQLMEDKTHMTDGIAVERHAGRQKVKWDAPLLRDHVVKAALATRVDPDTGEVLAEKVDAVVDGLTQAYALDIPSVRPRAGWLKKHDLEPDSYRSFEWGAPYLQMQRPKRGED